MKSDRAIAYPFPMHLSQGFTYHLSILQFTIALSRRLPVFLISLDTRDEIEETVDYHFGEQIPESLSIITVGNRKFGFKSNTLWFRRGALQAIVKLAKRYQWLAIYTRNVKTGGAIFSAKTRLPKNIVRVFESHQLFSQNLSFDCEFERARREYRLEQRLYNNCDLIFVNTSLLRNQIRRLFQKDSFILPLAVRAEDLADPKDFSKQNYCVREYDFAYVGSFDPWKGVDVFIEALAIIAKNGWAGRAVLVGVKSQELSLWEEKLSTLAVSEYVDLYPRISKQSVKNILDRAKVGVIPNSMMDDSLLNTSPLKVFDYAARGLRLLVSKVPAIYADVDAPDISWFKPDDPIDMAHNLAVVAGSSIEPSVGNYNWASQYTWDKRADRVIELIEKRAND